MNLKESMSSITFSPQFRNSEMNRGRISEFQKGDYPDQKLQKMIDELKFDQIDTIDLTCASMSYNESQNWEIDVFSS